MGDICKPNDLAVNLRAARRFVTFILAIKLDVLLYRGAALSLLTGPVKLTSILYLLPVVLLT